MQRTLHGPDYDTEVKRILASDLSFKDQRSTYGPHSLHAFAAKFPPQLPKVLIESLTQPGEVVCDVMAGSGTTLVEAAIANRQAIGLDIDPLATMVAKTKTSRLDDGSQEVLDRIMIRASKKRFNPPALSKEFRTRFDLATQTFIRFWFFPETINQLLSLSSAIEHENNIRLRRYLQVVLSSIIVTKSGGVSRARDLAHSRPHLDPEKKPKEPMEVFPKRLRKTLDSLRALYEFSEQSTVIQSDARHCPLRDESVHLIVTSPPYANALDYMRAHKFSLVWLGQNIGRLSKLRGEYIGNERVHNPENVPEEASELVNQLTEKDARKATLLAQYFTDMLQAITEMKRILVRKRYAILVVGPSTMRGISIPSHQCLTSIAERLGFEVVGLKKRSIDRDKRMLPVGNNSNGNGIELRMHDEYIIVLKKP